MHTDRIEDYDPSLKTITTKQCLVKHINHIENHKFLFWFYSEETQAQIEKSITALHASPYKVCGAFTGAGAGLQKMLWDVAGASNTIIALDFPYDTKHTVEKLYYHRDYSGSMVHPDVAFELAKCNWPENEGLNKFIVGVGCTAAVSTSRERKGKNHAYFSILGNINCDEFYYNKSFYLTLEKGILSRQEEGALVDIVALNIILEAAKIEKIDINLEDFGAKLEEINVEEAEEDRD